MLCHCLLRASYVTARPPLSVQLILPFTNLRKQIPSLSWVHLVFDVLPEALPCSILIYVVLDGCSVSSLTPFWEVLVERSPSLSLDCFCFRSSTLGFSCVSPNLSISVFIFHVFAVGPFYLYSFLARSASLFKIFILYHNFSRSFLPFFVDLHLLSFQLHLHDPRLNSLHLYIAQFSTSPCSISRRAPRPSFHCGLKYLLSAGDPPSLILGPRPSENIFRLDS